MRPLFTIGLVLAASVLAMRWAGLRQTIPLALIYIVLLVFPFAFGLAAAIRWLEGSKLPTRWHVVVAPWLGVAGLCVYWPDRCWFLYPTILAALVVGAIYVIVWNANYLALAASRSRLHDVSMRELDEAIYSAIVGRTISYPGWFPLTHRPWLIEIFERAYLALFAEIALALVLVARNPPALRCFIARLALCYAGGLLLFVLWPIAGPYLAYPSSISATFSGANTRAIMEASLIEFSAIRSGGQPITGFGYFVGFPSLHVAMGVLLQFTIQQRSRVAGWAVAPINVLLVVSTVVLGYHYLADVPGGALLALGSVVLVRRGPLQV